MIAEPAKAGACVEHDTGLAAHDLDAARVAADEGGVRPGRGDAPANAPETNPHVRPSTNSMPSKNAGNSALLSPETHRFGASGYPRGRMSRVLICDDSAVARVSVARRVRAEGLDVVEQESAA